MGDMKLIFHDGRSTKVDSRKLKMASLGGILHNLIEDIVDVEVVGNKGGRDYSDLPTFQVSAMYPIQNCTSEPCRCGKQKHALISYLYMMLLKNFYGTPHQLLVTYLPVPVNQAST